MLLFIVIFAWWDYEVINDLSSCTATVFSASIFARWLVNEGRSSAISRLKITVCLSWKRTFASKVGHTIVSPSQRFSAGEAVLIEGDYMSFRERSRREDTKVEKFLWHMCLTLNSLSLPQLIVVDFHGILWTASYPSRWAWNRAILRENLFSKLTVWLIEACGVHSLGNHLT